MCYYNFFTRHNHAYLLISLYICWLDLTPEWLLVIQHVQLLQRIIRLQVCDTKLLSFTTRAHLRKEGVLLKLKILDPEELKMAKYSQTIPDVRQ